MKSLFEYEFLVNEVFYRCQHILKYIENNPNMNNLEFKAIEATIMDALVYKNLIDPNKQSLDLKKLCIVDNLNYYKYEKNPDVCGIPQWMKEEFRKKSLVITGGIPISLFLAKPPSKISRYCVYDPNTAVSSIFPDATFYNVFYNSPTRNKRIEEKRPFVEVNIDNELYLVDTLTKRIFKSNYFKENYGFEIIDKCNIKNLNKVKMMQYNDMIETQISLCDMIPFLSMFTENDLPSFAEMLYELEKSKEYFKDQWNKYEENNKLLQQYTVNNFIHLKTKK